MPKKRVPVNTLVTNDQNPRNISEKSTDDLVLSLLTFPAMLYLREIVVDRRTGEMKTQGGNMRLLGINKILEMSTEQIIKAQKSVEEENVVQYNIGFWEKVLKTESLPGECIKYADEFITEKQLDEFIIKDNVAFGKWDKEMLEQMHDIPTMQKWGIELPEWDVDDIDIDSFFEANPDGSSKAEDESTSLTLNYSEEEMVQVREGLLKVASTYEDAVWQLLGLDPF